MKQTRWFQPNLVDFWFYLSFWFVGFLETVFVFLVLESKKPKKKSWKNCFFINKYHFTFFCFSRCAGMKNAKNMEQNRFWAQDNSKKLYRWNDTLWWKKIMRFLGCFDSKTKKPLKETKKQTKVKPKIIFLCWNHLLCFEKCFFWFS